MPQAQPLAEIEAFLQGSQSFELACNDAEQACWLIAQPLTSAPNHQCSAADA